MPTEKPASVLTPPKKRHPNGFPPALTRSRQRQLLEKIAATGRMKQSCLDLRIDLNAPFRWATTSAWFAKKLEAAKAEGERVLLAEYEHSLDAKVLTAESIDDYAKIQNSQFFRMKRLDPAYRDNAQVNVQMHGPVAILFSRDENSPNSHNTPTNRQADSFSIDQKPK